MHMRSFRNWSYYWSKKNPHFAVSRWRRRMTTLFGQHGCSKNNVPILLLYWAKCLLQIKAGKIKPVLTTCQPGSQHTTSPFLSPNSLPCPPFLLYHILELFTTQAPQNWRLMRCAPPPSTNESAATFDPTVMPSTGLKCSRLYYGPGEGSATASTGQAEERLL